VKLSEEIAQQAKREAVQVVRVTDTELVNELNIADVVFLTPEVAQKYGIRSPKQAAFAVYVQPKDKEYFRLKRRDEFYLGFYDAKIQGEILEKYRNYETKTGEYEISVSYLDELDDDSARVDFLDVAFVVCEKVDLTKSFRFMVELSTSGSGAKIDLKIGKEA